MAGIMGLVIQLLIDNALLLMLFFMNLFLIFIVIRFKQILGFFFNDTLQIALFRMRNPAMFIHFMNSQKIDIQWKEFSSITKVNDTDPNSEYVYVEKGNALQVGTSQPSKKLYYDHKHALISIDPNNEYMSWGGYRAHIIYENQPSTQNPIKAVQQSEILKEMATALSSALVGFQVLLTSRDLKEIAKKSDVQFWGLISTLIPLFAVVILIFIFMAFQEQVLGFIGTTTTQITSILPQVQSFVKQIPTLIPDLNNWRP